LIACASFAARGRTRRSQPEAPRHVTRVLSILRAIGLAAGESPVEASSSNPCDEDETCDSCTANCHSEADCGYCGDGLCAADENGGAGTLNSGHCDQVAHTWCAYCPDDCGACDWQYCHEQASLVCDDTTGACRSCYIDQECADWSQWCDSTGTGKCTDGDYCDSLTPCPLGGSCNDYNVCRPTV
jgi:hypothetical protein